MSKPAAYVQVAPSIPLPATGPQTYTYRFPTSQPTPPALYQLVTVPFGRQTTTGVIMGLEKPVTLYRTRPIHQLLPAAVTAYQVQFAEWIAATMHGGLGYTVRLFYPPLPKKGSPAAPHLLTAVRGKPTVYIERNSGQRLKTLQTMADQAVRQGKQVLMLVPEKWMLTQLATSFENTAAVIFHGGLSKQQAHAIWQGVASGQIQIVIGTQKALFLPFINLGLIVVEEEYFETHKLWDQYPRLHNVRAAQTLATITHASLVLSGEFFSLARFYEIKRHQATLKGRLPALPSAPRFVPFTPAERHDRASLPHELIQQMRTWLSHHERVGVLYNRRGGWPAIAPALKTLLAPYPLFHLDADTLRKHTETKLSSALRQHQLIIATSALFAFTPTLALDRLIWLFPEQVALYPDFRSSERALRLRQRLQSLLPARRAITVVSRQPHRTTDLLSGSPTALYKKILQERTRLSYPPLTDCVRLTFVSKDSAQARERAAATRRILEQRPQAAAVIIRGPFPGFAKQRERQAEQHLLLIGSLPAVVSLYHDMPIDRVDVDPERIL